MPKRLFWSFGQSWFRGFHPIWIQFRENDSRNILETCTMATFYMDHIIRSHIIWSKIMWTISYGHISYGHISHGLKPLVKRVLWFPKNQSNDFWVHWAVCCDAFWLWIIPNLLYNCPCKLNWASIVPHWNQGRGPRYGSVRNDELSRAKEPWVKVGEKFEFLDVYLTLN